MKKLLMVAAIIAVSGLSAMGAPDAKTPEPNFGKGRGQRRRNRLANRVPGRFGEKLQMRNAKNSPTAALQVGTQSTKPKEQARWAQEALSNAYVNYEPSPDTIKASLNVLKLDSALSFHELNQIAGAMLFLYEKYEESDAYQDESKAKANPHFSAFWALKGAYFEQAYNPSKTVDWQTIVKEKAGQGVLADLKKNLK